MQIYLGTLDVDELIALQPRIEKEPGFLQLGLVQECWREIVAVHRQITRAFQMRDHFTSLTVIAANYISLTTSCRMHSELGHL